MHGLRVAGSCSSLASNNRLADRVQSVESRRRGQDPAYGAGARDRFRRSYSLLGRGFLTGQIQSPDDFEEDDFQRTSPRFQGENFRKNLELVERVKEIAAEKGVMPGQLALAWLLHQGEDIVSIPVPNAASTWKRTPLL
jgi:Aldo/keto reductase family